ncbi:MAG: DUF697 domain-containing protein [Chromatiales bacterium]
MIWKRVLDALLPWRKNASPEAAASGPAGHVDLARESLQSLLADRNLPAPVRRGLAAELAGVQAMLDKLEHGHIHIAVFGRVGVGKSALLNALLHETRFSTSPLHGETREPQSAVWQEWDDGGLFLIDTPGINDIDGEERERQARAVAARADLILFVVDGDLSGTEMQALRVLIAAHRPVLLVFNKIDRYTDSDRALLLDHLKLRGAGLIPPDHIVCTAAEPAERIYLEADAHGREIETRRPAPADVESLRSALWSILEAEGKTLMALNATLFAGSVSDAIGQRIVAIKKELADGLIRKYCVAKGVVVGLNPVPISDLVAAGLADVGLVFHLARIYGLPVTTAEAGGLLRTIAAQMALVMGTVWAVHFVASVMKGSTAGLSTFVTGTAQGAVAYYSAYVVGRAAQSYFALGRSWGPNGPKRVVQEILDSLDRESLLGEAREQIAQRLRYSGTD